jgi:ubiquinone/menaquinone biosynthesis C-methylase UbiE
MLGHEAEFRERVLDLAELESGETVLDVGSGTGALAIRAKTRVGQTGLVCGIDASPEMVAAAERKAKKARADVAFRRAIVEELPFRDASFDAALSTLMLHHLPRPARAACAGELRRVVRPGGRVVVVDFGAPASRRLLDSFFHRHGYVAHDEIVRVLTEAGFSVEKSGPLGFRDLQFVIGRTPA